MTHRQQDKDRIIQLAQKWEAGTLTPEEKKEFDQWYELFNDTEMPPLAKGTPAQLKERLYASILTQGGLHSQRGARIFRFRVVVWMASAAVLLLAVSLTLLNRLRTPQPGAAATASVRPSDTTILPGHNRAILTLAGGSRVILDSAKNGWLARQGNTGIVKEKDGFIAYEEPGTGGIAGATGPLYNTITTPRGGQYAVTLPDGTKVWLNAASSIRFPTAFTGPERLVQVSGEAYFEVAPNQNLPFRATIEYPSSGKIMEVEVLGTQFNVMAYEDESTIRTTLLQGAVRVLKGANPAAAEGKVLRPGQQAQLKDDHWHVLDNADVEEAVAWKNGRTLFAGEDIRAIMRKVCRWYNVDVEYRGLLPERKFTGGIARNSDISVLLQILALNHIHYSVEGRKIILMP